MKLRSRICAAFLAVLVVVAPLAALSDQLATPIERKVTPGVTVIHYAGQDLRFTTPVALLVRLKPIGTTKISLQVSAYSGSYSPTGSSAQIQLQIFWVNYDNTIYDGSVPPFSNPLEEVLLTEAGFTEK